MSTWQPWRFLRHIGGQLFELIRPPFLEASTPPPFYQADLSAKRRLELDCWFIGERSKQYYLRQFARIDKAGRLCPSWHWASFISAFGWLLYRKRYLDCFVYCVAGISFIKVTMVLSIALLQFLVIRHLPEMWQLPAQGTIALLIWVFWAVQVARWSNAYYYRMARREIADALRLYPSDRRAQEVYLRQHGGVSLLGLMLAFALFGTVMGIIAKQFVPLFAQKQEQALVYEAYQTVSRAKDRVAHIYEREGCPTQLPLTAHNQRFTMQVVSQVAGVASDCAIVLTVNKARYPIRYLNGQTLVLYRVPSTTGVWRCQSSLNSQAIPKSCVN